MRIGVERAVEQDLFQIGVKEFLGENRAVQIEVGERAEFSDLGAFDVFHREDFFGRLAFNGQRNANAFELAQIVVKGHQVGGFPAVI